jgi:hypothetical protein
MPRQAGNYAPRNSETDEDDDADDYRYSHGYPTREIKKNALNAHRDSVNLVETVCKVTLVSSLMRLGRIDCDVCDRTASEGIGMGRRGEDSFVGRRGSRMILLAW